MKNKTKTTKRKFSHHKIKLTGIESWAIEREWAEWASRYNSEIPKWQQEMYQ